MVEQDETKISESEGMVNLIVGIGASAGGLEALQRFFNSMSATSNLSFVVIQHLSPDYKSLLAEILGKNTKMAVVQADDGIEVLPNCVYLIPPKKNMIIEDGKLHLTEYTHVGINHPIDIFFNSLANEMKERAIAVVLSGTGTDGTSGIKAVKEQCGLVIVQEPSSAKFDGMPRSAINTGLVDFVLTPEQIAVEILNFSNYPSIAHDDDDRRLFSNEEMLMRIYTILRKNAKIDFSHYKRNTLLRRIERRMVVMHKEKLSEYIDMLEENPDEAKTLGKEILIGVTNFFRDASYFEKLKQVAIMSILQRSKPDDEIRIWSAGCSTGEEAYSIAILFAEAMEALDVERNVKIFATDVDAEAINFASRGVYSESIVDDVSHERFLKYFTKKGECYAVNKVIRQMIRFAPHNIFQDPPFGKLDLICCRNVMIYFQTILQKNLFSIFHSALKDGGFLFLGKSETTGEFSEVFVPICIAEKIYTHDSKAKVPNLVPIPFTMPRMYPTKASPIVEMSDDRIDIPLEKQYLNLLETYMPPAVVVDSKNDIIHTFGRINSFLRFPTGKAGLNIFDLVHEELSLVISTALKEARTEKKLLAYKEIQLTDNGVVRSIQLTIQPIIDKSEVFLDLVAIIFSDPEMSSIVPDAEKYDINKTAAQRIIDLERELQDSRDNLRATIGELETVNEELQAANEELLTANEELQSSNEELQSVNEELYTVNAEYQQKLGELTDLNNDLSNFLSSTMIGILFVDHEMNIRKFTDYVGREFHLMEQDIDRPLQLLSHHFTDFDLVADATEVIKTLIPNEKEVTSTDGKRYKMRISPYRTTSNTIKGVVITLIDDLFGSEE
ncbi:MAG: chemotaxis protein CheB [Fibrobacter sp.]|nr:chemotaxis protein CheB [Fibrobacter sp.]